MVHGNVYYLKMGNIRVLESKVISQIAAGEVVERPASVVKELIENSLDAQSSQISIEIKGGGIGMIRITDDGLGIPDEETELAFQRHATSKISDISDLQTISTLGFRGEALPSIASVAQVQLVSCHKDATSGTYLSLDDGQVVKHETQARSAGTTLTVYNLFRKIPARLKFLKSESSEAGRIADVVSQYALAYPEVRFSLTSESKNLLRTPGSGKLIDAAVAVYGLEIAQNMLEINSLKSNWDSGKSEIVVTGLVGSPKISRSTRDFLSFFVNRRWVNNRLLSFAVEEAYQGLLMQGKHPISIINITIPPGEIDVNVHPAKTEIKFRDERAVFGAVQKAVRATLIQSSPVAQVEEIKPQFGTPSNAYTVPDRPLNRPDLPAYSPSSVSSQTPLISLPLLRILGQIAKNYIAAEGPDGLFLIDQHAAHERIQYEKIRNQRASKKVEVQGLLEPTPFEVEPKQAGLLSAHKADLAEFGFEIEPFGEKTFLVRAVPALLKDRDWKMVLRDCLDNPAANWSDKLSISLACHSAIRAGQQLNDTEMRELVKQLEQTALPNSCPHGRPTIIHLTLQQIEKEFGRTG